MISHILHRCYTAYLLAGKDTKGERIKKACSEKIDAQVINLKRLQRLLVGDLTFDSMAKLTPLTKDSFKDDLYEVAGALPVLRTAIQSNSSTSAGHDGDDRNE